VDGHVQEEDRGERGVALRQALGRGRAMSSEGRRHSEEIDGLWRMGMNGVPGNMSP
jgi:hypothetical protein